MRTTLFALATLALLIVPATAEDYAHHHPSVPATAEAAFAHYDSDPAPTIKILSPTEGQTLLEGMTIQLFVELAADGIVLKDKSHHVHVWVDDQPYKAMYDATQPFEITGLGPGSHTIQVAPSRPWHETFKNDGAYDAVNFVIGASDGKFVIDHALPTVTYSRPKKGLTHTFEESRLLLLDYYLHGCTLGEDGYAMRVTVNGQSYLYTSWVPVYAENLPPGDYTIELELLKDGVTAEANYNPIGATFTIAPPVS